MASFGLIAEGITDQFVIEEILYIYFGDNEPEIRQLQPIRDETDAERQGNYGNWQKVFDYCQSADFQQSLETQDFVIVHVDTDVSEDVHFDIPHQENGQILADEVLFQRVLGKFVEQISEEIYQKFKEKIIFAIGIHSIECWLLPIYFSDNKKSKSVNCLETLNQALKKEGFSIDPKHKNHFKGKYRKIAQGFGKKKDLEKYSKHNFGFSQFIFQLSKIAN
jgi:hypothetical protein